MTAVAVVTRHENAADVRGSQAELSTVGPLVIFVPFHENIGGSGTIFAQDRRRVPITVVWIGDSPDVQITRGFAAYALCHDASGARSNFSSN